MIFCQRNKSAAHLIEIERDHDHQSHALNGTTDGSLGGRTHLSFMTEDLERLILMYVKL